MSVHSGASMQSPLKAGKNHFYISSISLILMVKLFLHYFYFFFLILTNSAWRRTKPPSGFSLLCQGQEQVFIIFKSSYYSPWFFKFTLMLSIILRMTLQHLCMHLGRTNFIRNAMVQTVLIIHSTFAFTLETVRVYNLVCHDRREGKATSYSLVVYGNVLKHLDLLLILLWI